MTQWHDALTVPQLVQTTRIKLANITGGFRSSGYSPERVIAPAFAEVEEIIRAIMARDAAAIEPVAVELSYLAAETGYAEAWRILSITRA